LLGANTDGLVSAQLIPQVIKDTQWGFVAPLSLAAIVLMPVGAYILRSTDPAVLTKLMAAVVLVFVVVLLAGWRYHGEIRLVSTLAVGAVSGVMMASTSLGNPPVLVYLLAGRDSAKSIRANVIMYFAVTRIVLLAVLGYMTLVTWPAMTTAAVIAPGYLIAAWVGSRLLREADEKSCIDAQQSRCCSLSLSMGCCVDESET
jgi:uncharacterized membrane protein YfcA